MFVAWEEEKLFCDFFFPIQFFLLLNKQRKKNKWMNEFFPYFLYFVKKPFLYI